MKELEHGEEWLVMSEQVAENPCLYRPSIKWGVTPDSFTHTTELFVPVLGVMKFKRLEEAIELPSVHEYGNGTSIFTASGNAAREYANRVEVGMVGINVPIPVPLAFHSSLCDGARLAASAGTFMQWGSFHFKRHECSMAN